MSERINEQDLSEKFHEKQIFLGITVRKYRKGKEENIAAASFGIEESAETTIGEVSKTKQYTEKKLGQSNQDNTSRTESTKE